MRITLTSILCNVLALRYTPCLLYKYLHFSGIVDMNGGLSPLNPLLGPCQRPASHAGQHNPRLIPRVARDVGCLILLNRAPTTAGLHLVLAPLDISL